MQNRSASNRDRLAQSKWQVAQKQACSGERSSPGHRNAGMFQDRREIVLTQVLTICAVPPTATHPLFLFLSPDFSGLPKEPQHIWMLFEELSQIGQDLDRVRAQMVLNTFDVLPLRLGVQVK